MKEIIGFIVLFLSSFALAIVPPTYTKEEVFSNAELFSTVAVNQGAAVFHGGQVCGVAYQGVVTAPSPEYQVGASVQFLMFSDVRGSGRFGFLEVGEQYFVTAVPAEDHQFYQLSDGLYRFPGLNRECIPEGVDLVINREFTGKLQEQDGQRFLTAPGIGLLSGIDSMPAIYWSMSEEDIKIGRFSKPEQFKQHLKFVGVEIEAFQQWLLAPSG